MKKGKIVERKKLVKMLIGLKEEGKKVVFTNGCFDLLHLGHVRYLERAKKYGDILVVAINTDASVERLKGKNRPLIPQQERAEILQALETVDYITFFDEDTPAEIIAELKPNVLVKGGDYKLNEIVGRKFIKDSGGKVVTIPLKKNHSTTKIIKMVIKKYGKN